MYQNKATITTSDMSKAHSSERMLALKYLIFIFASCSTIIAGHQQFGITQSNTFICKILYITIIIGNNLIILLFITDKRNCAILAILLTSIVWHL